MLHLEERFNATAYYGDHVERAVPGIGELGGYEANITIEDVENYLHRLALGFSFGLAHLTNQSVTCFDCGYGYGRIDTVQCSAGQAPVGIICLITIVAALAAITAEFRAAGIWMGNSLMRVLVLGGGMVRREGTEGELGIASDGDLIKVQGNCHFVVGTDLTEALGHRHLVVTRDLHERAVFRSSGVDADSGVDEELEHMTSSASPILVGNDES
ncbi:hypothetical protein HDV00_007196 [Rhizophlyctis rosea]|nr:hypothetical protein HDV00_007196 [Rhizophlyctis rosea]